MEPYWKSQKLMKTCFWINRILGWHFQRSESFDDQQITRNHIPQWFRSGMPSTLPPLPQSVCTISWFSISKAFSNFQDLEASTPFVSGSSMGTTQLIFIYNSAIVLFSSSNSLRLTLLTALRVIGPAASCGFCSRKVGLLDVENIKHQTTTNL